MRHLEEVHEEIVTGLHSIRKICNEMREEGLGGEDFEKLYVIAHLIPSITEILLSKESKNES